MAWGYDAFGNWSNLGDLETAAALMPNSSIAQQATNLGVQPNPTVSAPSIPQNPYFNTIQTPSSMSWGDTPAYDTSYNLNAPGMDFDSWTRQFTDPNYRSQYAYTDGNGQQLNALPNLWRLAQTGYFNQFGQLTPAQQEWLGYNIAREQESMDDHGASDLTVLSMLAAPIAGIASAAYNGAGSTTAAAESALSSGTSFTGSGAATTAAPSAASGASALGMGTTSAGLLDNALAQGGNTMTDVPLVGNGVQMPAPQIPTDPTFGGSLTQTGTGQFENLGNIQNFGGSLQPTATPPIPPMPQVPTPPTQTSGIPPQVAVPAAAAPIVDEFAGMDDVPTGQDDIMNDPLELDNLNTPTTTENPLSGFDWNSIPTGIRNAIQSALAPQTGVNWFGLGSDLMALSGQRDYQQGLLSTMNRAIDYSDPAFAQRGQYQNQFNQMQTDPNWMQNDAMFQNMNNVNMRNVAGRNEAKGYMNSGNILHDLTRTGMETLAPYGLQRMQQVGEAGGLLGGRQNASGAIAALGQAAGQAGLGQTQAMQSMLGRIPTGMQNTANNAINSGLSSLFNSFNS